jgi:hypothetical protein
MRSELCWRCCSANFHPVLDVKEVNDMSSQDWFNACNAVLSQDITALYNCTIACGIVVVVFVKLFFVNHAITITGFRAHVFAIGAMASDFMFKRWWRIDEYDRQRFWNNYGRFCGIM